MLFVVFPLWLLMFVVFNFFVSLINVPPWVSPCAELSVIPSQVTVSFFMLGKFLAIISLNSSNIFSGPFSVSYTGTPIVNVSAFNCPRGL